MKEIVADSSLIAYCGLYCGACRRYLREACPGCAGNDKASWCKVRACCLENGYSGCAACAQMENTIDCRRLHNLTAWVFGILFRSNRQACIDRIREVGRDQYAREMASSRKMTLPGK